MKRALMVFIFVLTVIAKTGGAERRVLLNSAGFESFVAGTETLANPDSPGETNSYFCTDSGSGEYLSVVAEYAGEVYAGGEFPFGFDGVGSKFLKMETGRNVLFRSINPTRNGTVGEPYSVDRELCFDLLLRPTMFEEEPTAWTPCSGSQPLRLTVNSINSKEWLVIRMASGLILNVDDKLRLFWQEVPDEEGEPIATNLCVQAGQIDSFSVAPVRETYVLGAEGVNVASADWFRVTIRTVKDMTLSERGILGFQVLINGKLAHADKRVVSDDCYSRECGGLPAAAKQWIDDKAVLPAYGHGSVPSASFSFMGMQGIGAIDDLSISSVVEEPVPVAETYYQSLVGIDYAEPIGWDEGDNPIYDKNFAFQSEKDGQWYQKRYEWVFGDPTQYVEPEFRQVEAGVYEAWVSDYVYSEDGEPIAPIWPEHSHGHTFP